MVAGVCAEDGKGFPVHVGIPQTPGLDDGSDPNQSINPLLISYLKVEPVDVADHTGHDNLDLGLGRPEVLDELKDLVGAGLALADAEPPARQVLRNHLGHAGLLRHHQHLGSGHLVKDYVDLVPVQHSDITLYLILSSYN